MTAYLDRAGLHVAEELAIFLEDLVLPGTGLEPAAFWQGTAAIFQRFAPQNRALLARRGELQAAIAACHRERRGKAIDASPYRSFLEEIGYLKPEPGPFQIGTSHCDAELA